MRDDPSRLRDLLGPFGQRLGLSDPAKTGLVWARWAETVGPAIAAHCSPSSLRDGLLRLRADSPAWATEVGYLGPEILRRINEMAGMELVTEVKVWVAPPSGPATSPKVPEVAGATPERAPRERSGDPQEALERARAAWARKMGKQRR